MLATRFEAATGRAARDRLASQSTASAIRRATRDIGRLGPAAGGGRGALGAGRGRSVRHPRQGPGRHRVRGGDHGRRRGRRRGPPLLRFNGTVEWALDSIQQDEVVWLPSEEQLRGAARRRLPGLDRAVTDSRVPGRDRRGGGPGRIPRRWSTCRGSPTAQAELLTARRCGETGPVSLGPRRPAVARTARPGGSALALAIAGYTAARLLLIVAVILVRLLPAPWLRRRGAAAGRVPCWSRSSCSCRWPGCCCRAQRLPRRCPAAGRPATSSAGRRAGRLRAALAGDGAGRPARTGTIRPAPGSAAVASPARSRRRGSGDG